ncbi:IMP cyclohydrolase /phosphoribosylaminoimidazolecarboxamide formyltransferase [Jatrophihabitans endophyticus]|uniref:Bifunctional purine biosynthesis protein PurH n=1 Tax=Jatrophihabitans endophyticus TaxID=1206085 RepID=A0A1M5GCW3_9ACTN|nr:bifunctional phosphoribosylaminoimidazolecarboxamide formyltransferase/IMP cyclohydrolase [Jatrophihabitans endophyticus]SHG01554.1 IMP cyclohydrolase /phosphoribosylaminoimidazolecarboxamide formyltransferase [Jatrophihabitans endophyticus]
MTRIAVRRALVSVYDKTGLDELARGLHAAGVEIVSTGSTAARIRELGVPVTAVDEVTGFPEILGGRVKTLHPHVHAGLLADQTDDTHVETITELGIDAFQLLVVNLYPFAQTVASGAAQPEVIEQIDIGGPAMVRASAKNHGSVAVVTDPSRYADVLDAVTAGGFDLPARQRLALAAFRHTASYDIAVASWLGSVVAPDDEHAGEPSGFPGWVASNYERAAVLRYGENPHQRAALYVTPGGGGVAGAEQLQGKEMSYNNYVDADAAWRAAYDFADPCVAIIKHANPCGIAVGADIAEAHRKAHACDPVSAYGGVVATNRPATLALAEQLADIFTEVVVAPSFEPEALERFGRKKNLRLLVAAPRPDAEVVEQRPVSGGLLLQTADRIDAPGDDPAAWTLQAGEPADPATLADLAFAWRAVRAVKSNAILLAADGATVGAGMGQVNRVDSCRLAVARAGERAAGAVAASDAFFPFADGAQVLLDAGVKAIVEPGGSIRDEDVVAAAKAAGVTLYFTGTRHFAH